MSCILTIETSTTVCSVALSLNKEIMYEKCSFEGPTHASLLGVYVKEALDVAEEKGVKPDAVAVSSGPGSYTGLRIGVSMAKGICFGLDIPLIAVSTLEILAIQAIQQCKDADLYCAMLDARRMEVYAAMYDSELKVIREVSADIVTEETYASFLENKKVAFFGNGAGKCQEVISSPQSIFIEDIYPIATRMIELAERMYAEKHFVDVAYFEPFYLKEFVATVAKNKVLGDHLMKK